MSSIITFLVIALLCLQAACWGQTAPAKKPPASKLAAEVLELTGGRRAKIVWARVPPGGERVEHVSGWWVKKKGTDAKIAISIVGFDTDKGVEQVIVKAPINCVNPWITYDGSKVIFTDFSENTCYVVDWDGRNMRVLGKGKYRFATSYWRDPKTGIEWVYYSLPYLQSSGHDGTMSICDPTAVWQKEGDPAIVRKRLDGTGDYETVWDKTSAWYDFRLSADGTHAGGSFPIWPNARVADLTTGESEMYGEGCVPNFAPDNSYRLFWFLGSHSQITFMDHDKQNRRTIKVDFPKNGMKGVEAWPIRWASDVQFVSLTGPIQQNSLWAPANVQLGRFNADFTAFDKWVTLTDTPNDLDSEPFMWVEPVGGVPTPVAVSPTPGPSTGPKPPARVVPQEADAPGTLFAWPIGKWDATPAVAFSADGTRLKEYRLDDQGYAHKGRRYQMIIKQGGFRATGAGAYVASQVNTSGCFSLSMLLTPYYLDAEGGRQIMALTNAGTKSFVLEQDKASLRISYRSKEGQQVQAKLADLANKNPAHLVVSAGPGELRAFVNGRQVLNQKVAGQPGSWSGDTLMFGDNKKTTLPWQGELESIAINSRLVATNEAFKFFEAARIRFASQPRAPAQLRVKARLLQRSAVLKPEGMNYTKGLSLFEYAVTEVLQGKYTDRMIYVYHLTMLDKEILPIAVRPLSEIYELTLEPFDAHPQLHSECQNNTLQGQDIDLRTMYLDVGR